MSTCEPTLSPKDRTQGLLSHGIMAPMLPPCPFCSLPHDRVISESSTTLTFRDCFPVSPGHTLIIPKRHVATFFDASRDELADITDALLRARESLDAELAPAGYNIGVNCGIAAGQTVMHLHVHLIPRYTGDVADPRGGIRHCIPGRGLYEPPP